MQLGVRPAIASAWSGGEQVGYQLPGRWMVPVVFAVLGGLVGLAGSADVFGIDWRYALAATAVTIVQWVLVGWLLLFMLASWVFAVAIAFGILKRAWESVARWNASARAKREADGRAEREATARS